MVISFEKACHIVGKEENADRKILCSESVLLWVKSGDCVVKVEGKCHKGLIRCTS